MSLDWERSREDYPGHNFDNWAKIPSPFVRCDLPNCGELATYVAYVRSGVGTIAFTCEKHMLELSKK